MNTRIIALACAVALAACKTDDRNAALVVNHVVIADFTPPSGTTAGKCAFSTGDGEIILPEYTLNDPGNGGLAGYVIQNQLTNPNTINTALDAPSTTFTAHQAVVNYDIQGQTVPEQIIPVSSGTVPSGTLAVVGVPLFTPNAVIAALQAAPDSFVRTTTRIEGRLDDGTTVSTSEHDYVVHWCPSCPLTTPTCF